MADLARYIQDLLANPNPQQDLSELQVQLSKFRPTFFNLLDSPPKNSKEKDELDKGIFTLNDKQYRANKDFIAESTFLSDALDCSEYYAAGLINQARPTPSAENGLIVFHNERAALISSLEAIWNGALSKDDVIRESGLQATLLRETGELTRGKGAELSQGSSAKGWINKILSTIDQLSIEANSLRTSLTQALPISTALTFGKPATKSKISFSDEITEMRIIRLELERHSLGQLLYRIAMARQFTAAEILSVTTWLANVTVQDGAAVYILTTLLALLDASGDYEYVEQVCLPLFYDRIFINSLNTLVTTKTWQVESLRSAVLLQWSLFLVGGSRYLPEFQTEMDIYEEDVERMIIEAVEGGVLTFLGRGLLSFKSDFEMEKLWGGIGLNVEGLGGESHVETRFQVYVTAQVESLVVAFITNGDSVLRKLKFREEDVVFSSHRGGGRRASRGGLDDRPTEQQHHLESLFLLVATIYYNAPDSGLKFWTDSFNDPASSSPAITSGTGGRHTFLRWGAECKAQGIRRAYYEMLASLSTGCRCAVYAFEFFSSNGNIDSNYQTSSNSSASWTTLFGALEYYSSNLSDQPLSMGSNINESVPTEISPDDTALLISFAKVLRQVVTYSDLARATLYDSQRYQPIATIFGILRRQVSIELKASLFGALAAFCRAGGTFGVDVARRTWSVLEQSQILPTMAISQNRDARGGVGLIGTGGGILRGQVPATLEGGILSELEEVEVTSRTFPGSMAFIDLLSALIHTPSLLAPLNRGAELDSQTIPDNLGIPYRTPGIDPYVRFVLDDVLLKSGQREYSDWRERWQVTSKSLAFVEKCLASYDLSPIITATAAASSRTSTGPTSPLSQLVLHPGFDILLRLLSGGRLLEIIVTIIVSGVDALDNNLAGTPLFANCLLRCMRIVRRTFELQSAFLEVVLPSLVESNVQLPQEKIGLMKNAKGLEQHLMYAGDAVAQIALLVSSTEDEMALIAVQILAVLAETPLFDAVDKFRELSKLRMNRLVGFLESSPETLRIKQAFAARLEAEISQSELELDDYSSVEGADYPQAIRSAILDLLLANTQSNRPGPNVAHLLLGFNVHSRTNEMEIDEPSASDSPITCLHITLDLLSQNTVHETDDEDDSPGVQLISRHPTFTAKCYQLLRQLCLHEYTSAAVSRYLRTRQQFFVRHCLALPFRVPVAFKGDLGEVNYNQGLKVITSSAALCGILESEAWILESAALELNVLASSDDKQRVLMLVGALFGTSDILEDDLPDFERERLEQASPRILEIFYAFDFTWFDAITPNETRLRHFAEVRFDSCLRTDANGCDIYDFDVLLSLLGNARRELQGRGALNTLEQQAEAKLEMKAIYENLVIENHRRAIQFSRYHGLRAWRSVLDITLAKAFHLLPSEGRHQSLLDLMDAILPPIAAQQTDQPISELLSGAAVLIMTKLRDEGARASVLESSDSLQSISPERLQNILRAVIQAILQPGVSPVVRGNLYAVMLNYIQYSNRLASTSPALSRSLADDSLISNVGDDLFSLDGGSTLVGGGSRRSGRRNALESGNLAILQSAIDRLLPVICKDAAAGHEVWRTVAFTVLDAIVLIAEEGRAMSKLLSILTKQGYLQSFVGSLKDAEVDLLEALKPDPESLNALYIYEAQMSFLTRLASTREGAERLMNAELLSKLAQCEYLGAKPQMGSSDMDFDGFLPAASERHHQLLLPALQLVVGTLVSFGSETGVATRQALAFVAGQRETLLLALKDCAAIQTMASLQEAHLIITLLGIVLPSVSDDELIALSSFGGLHSALITLSSKVCSSQAWVSAVAPMNDTEREEEQTFVISLRGDTSVYSERVDMLAESLETATLTYHSVATRRKAGSNAFKPVYLPSIKFNDSGKGFSAPSIGSATIFLKDITLSLAQRLQDVAEITYKIDNFDSTAMAELESALMISNDMTLDANEQRQYLLQELKALQLKSRSKVASSLHLVELSLLLYWRHIAFFLDPERPDRDLTTSRPEFGLGLAESIRARGSPSLSTFDSTSLRDDIADAFSSVSQRLSNLKLNVKTLGPSVNKVREAQSYIETVVRRIQDLVSVNE